MQGSQTHLALQAALVSSQNLLLARATHGHSTAWSWEQLAWGTACLGNPWEWSSWEPHGNAAHGPWCPKL